MTVGCYVVTRDPNPVWLAEAKASAEACGFDRLAIVDDGSKSPVEGADFRFPENVGVVGARNKAVSMLDTDWICMVDDDDRFIPENAKALKSLLPSLDADVVSFPVELFGEETGHWATDPDMSAILDANQIPAGSWYRKKVWERLKFEVYPAEDWDFWARAWRDGFRFAHVGIPVYAHRVRQGSLSRDWTGEKFLGIRKKIYENNKRKL